MILLSFVSVALAGWTQPAGHHYVKAGARGVVGSLAFPASGVEAANVPVGRAQDWALQLYGEYGLTDAWTLVGQGAPLGWASYEGESTLYTGRLSVGAKRALLTGKHRLAATGSLSYTPPLGERDLTQGSLDGLSFIPTESTFGAGAGLSYGLGFGQNWLVANAGATWLSAAQLDPVVEGMVQLGRTTKRGNRWDLHLPWRLPLGPVEAPANFAGSGQTAYLGMGVGYTYTWGQGWGVATSFESVAAARANFAAPTIPLFVEHQGGV
ncbi:MAG: hypothetical protein H6741_00550 [Alphaproteobacteria bacterium]|nr:hypothetical protein [Alphaproteobacteria bacterium]MCB9791194.1 hypothetical protein [Alphaproteobacteria bacterium]